MSGHKPIILPGHMLAARKLREWRARTARASSMSNCRVADFINRECDISDICGDDVRFGARGRTEPEGLTFMTSPINIASARPLKSLSYRVLAACVAGVLLASPLLATAQD